MTKTRAAKKRLQEKSTVSRKELAAILSAKKLKQEDTFGQAAIAALLNKDPRSISRYCRQGLPHKRGEPGKEHRIQPAAAIHWYIGDRYARARGLELSPLEKILWALAAQEVSLARNPQLHFWKSRMLKDFNLCAATRDEISFAIGHLYGLGCLPFA